MPTRDRHQTKPARGALEELICPEDWEPKIETPKSSREREMGKDCLPHPILRSVERRISFPGKVRGGDNRRLTATRLSSLHRSDPFRFDRKEIRKCSNRRSLFNMALVIISTQLIEPN